MSSALSVPVKPRTTTVQDTGGPFVNVPVSELTGLALMEAVSHAYGRLIHLHSWGDVGSLVDAETISVIKRPGKWSALVEVPLKKKAGAHLGSVTYEAKGKTAQEAIVKAALFKKCGPSVSVPGWLMKEPVADVNEGARAGSPRMSRG
jgi:hypothetical protein